MGRNEWFRPDAGLREYIAQEIAAIPAGGGGTGTVKAVNKQVPGPSGNVEVRGVSYPYGIVKNTPGLPVPDGYTLPDGDTTYFIDEAGYCFLVRSTDGFRKHYIVGGDGELFSGDMGPDTGGCSPFIIPFDVDSFTFDTPILIPSPPWAETPLDSGLAFEGGYYGVIGNGGPNPKIYFGGGDGNFGSEGCGENGGGNWLASFDPDGSVFDFSLTPCPDGHDYCAFAVADEKLWVWGGDSEPVAVDGIYPDRVMHVYDPETDTWETIAGPPAGFDQYAAPGAPLDPTIDRIGKGDWCIGIQFARRIFWLDYGMAYDIDAQTWKPIGDVATKQPGTGPYNSGFYRTTDPGVFLLGNSDEPGSYFVMTGAGRDPDYPVPTDNSSKHVGTRIFDPSDDTWRAPELNNLHYIFCDVAPNNTYNGVLPPDGVVKAGSYWGLSYDNGFYTLGGNTGVARCDDPFDAFKAFMTNPNVSAVRFHADLTDVPADTDFHQFEFPANADILAIFDLDNPLNPTIKAPAVVSMSVIFTIASADDLAVGKAMYVEIDPGDGGVWATESLDPATAVPDLGGKIVSLSSTWLMAAGDVIDLGMTHNLDAPMSAIRASVYITALFV